jgi:CO/xanthine dehydrogenase Mo-binding subunit
MGDHTFEVSPEFLRWDGEPPYEWNAIGKSGLKHVDADEKVQGTAIYTRDIIVPNMLYAKPLVSPYAHAEIKNIDTTKAEALRGVIKVLTWKTPELELLLESAAAILPPGASSFLGESGPPLPGYATYEGQPCGAIVIAESEDIADEGVRLLEVEWEELPFVLDPDAALEEGAPIADPENNPEDNILVPYTTEEIGDVDAGFKEADGIAEFSTSRAYNTYAGVEAGSSVARMLGNQLEVWIHTQEVSNTSKVSTLCGIPVNMLNAHGPYGGGTYGHGKVPGASCAPLAVLSAMLTRRPVKFLYDAAVSHFYGGSDDYGKSNIKVGFKNDGTITAVQADFRQGDGHDNAIFSSNIYYLFDSTSIPNIQGTWIHAQTNQGATSATRCEGLASANLYSMVMNRVAAELNMDATEVALKNDGNCGDGSDWLDDYKARHGFPARDSLTECMDVGRKAADWDNKLHAAGTKKLANGKMHGIGCNWLHGWHNHESQTCDCTIEICHDGTVRILGQYCDTGVSGPSAYCQIVAGRV